MNPLAKALISLGTALIFAGLIWAAVSHFGWRGLPFGRLPGDLSLQSHKTRIYFPITTCLLLSVIFSLLVSLWKRFSR